MYACVFANLHTFRGLVADSDLKQPADARARQGTLPCATSGCDFRSDRLGFFSRPMARELWRLSSDALDFRAAQNEDAVIPRGGPWYSRWGNSICGTMRLASPMGENSVGLPGEIPRARPSLMGAGALRDSFS